MDKIKVSAIMPNYNGAQFLSRSIQSLVDQTEPFDEIIIIDDGSTDDSIEIISSFMKKYPVLKLIKHPTNQGVNTAINTGMAYATGDYIVFCATDDWFSPSIVSRSKAVAKCYPGVGIICGDGIINRFDLNYSFYRMLPFPPNTYLNASQFKAFAYKTYVGFNSAGGMFMNRKAIVEAGLIYSETRWHGDWLLYFVVALRYGIYYFNDIFIHVEMRKKSYSEGKNNHQVQNKVMLDLMYIIRNDYPDLWADFKKAALVPHHALRYIPLFLQDPIARQFITPRFIWKMIINNSFIVKLSRLFPYHIILKTRKLLRA